MVEMAFVLPIFLLLVFGLIDLGRFVLADSILSQASREGARLAAVEAGWIGSGDAACGQLGGPICPADVSSLITDIRDATNREVAGLGGSITSVYLSCDAPGQQPSDWKTFTAASCLSNGPGNVVSVRVIYTYRAITPVISALIGPVLRQGAATMVIN
jgi:hypothetical protein